MPHLQQQQVERPQPGEPYIDPKLWAMWDWSKEPANVGTRLYLARTYRIYRDHALAIQTVPSARPLVLALMRDAHRGCKAYHVALERKLQASVLNTIDNLIAAGGVQ